MTNDWNRWLIDLQNRNARHGGLRRQEMARLVGANVSGDVNRLGTHQEALGHVRRQLLLTNAGALQVREHRHPGPFGLFGVQERYRTMPEVLVLGSPGYLQPEDVAVREHPRGRDLHSRFRDIDENPNLRRVARARRRLAAALAVSGNQLEAV